MNPAATYVPRNFFLDRLHFARPNYTRSVSRVTRDFWHSEDSSDSTPYYRILLGMGIISLSLVFFFLVLRTKGSLITQKGLRSARRGVGSSFGSACATSPNKIHFNKVIGGHISRVAGSFLRGFPLPYFHPFVGGDVSFFFSVSGPPSLEWIGPPTPRRKKTKVLSFQ